MTCFRIFGWRLSVALLFFALISACNDQVNPEFENRAHNTELIQIPVSENDYIHSEIISESRDNAITQVVRQSRGAVVTVAFYPHMLLSESDSEEDTGSEMAEATNSTTISYTRRSGFFISPDGHVITKYRYGIDPGSEIFVHTFNGGEYPAKIVGSDPYSGITLLQVDGLENNEYMDFGNSDSLMVGEWSIALGVPDEESRMDSQPSVSAGVINALSCMIENPELSETVYPDLIRTDAVITSSSEGGPMLNASGQVIGLNTYIPTGDGSEGIFGYGYAIPGNKVARLVNHLADGDSVTLNYSVGLEMVPVTKVIAGHYNLPVQQGLLVLGVNRDGPAYESGVLPGDVIIRIGEDLIHGDTHAWAVLRRFNKGDLMPVTLMRGDQKLKTQILLRKRLKESEQVP